MIIWISHMPKWSTMFNPTLHLRAVLWYNLESGCATNLDQLSELFVWNYIKSHQSESFIRYFLSVESTSELGSVNSTKTTSNVDCYLDNCIHVADRPRASASFLLRQEVKIAQSLLLILPSKFQRMPSSQTITGLSAKNRKVASFSEVFLIWSLTVIGIKTDWVIQKQRML